MKVGSLFAGIGGFDLGLERAGFEITFQVEIDPYCRRVLAKHWPHVQRYGDIRTIDWATVPRVDVLCGGFPCQDLSFAGKRAGIDGERSGLWSEYVRAIRALRPRFVIVENVPGLLTNEYMGRVLGDLAASGYDAEWDCLPASAFGAKHERDRVWIVAHAAGDRLETHAPEEGLCVEALIKRDGGRIGATSCTNMVFSESTYRTMVAEPNILGITYGLPHRVDRFRGLGNAIVPQIAEWIGRQIKEVIR